MAGVKFDTFGSTMGFQAKLIKHIEANNPVRLKDYLCAGFDNFQPTDIKNHPCISMILDAEKVLKSSGWKCGLYDWGEEKGVQYTCVSPNDEWYRSHYQY